MNTSGELTAHHGRDLVLDLRFDVGGDITQTRELLRELPNDVTGKDACLPNSHLCLRVSDGVWDLIKGCAAEGDCYGDRFDPPVGSLDPQLKAPLTAAAWLSGRDPGMEAIMTKITKSRKKC